MGPDHPEGMDNFEGISWPTVKKMAGAKVIRKVQKLVFSNTFCWYLVQLALTFAHQ